MTFIDGIFFFYIFVGLYMTFLLLLLHLYARKSLFEHPRGAAEPVSIIVPCYNAEKSIGQVIESLLKLDYPKEMMRKGRQDLRRRLKR